MSDLKYYSTNVELKGYQIKLLLDLIAENVRAIDRRISLGKSATAYVYDRRKYLVIAYSTLNGCLPEPNRVPIEQLIREKQASFEAWKAKQQGYPQQSQQASQPFPQTPTPQPSQPVRQEGPYKSDYMNRQTAPNNSPQNAPQSPNTGYTPVYPPKEQSQPNPPNQNPYPQETPFPAPEEGQKNTAPVQTYENPPIPKDSDLPPF